jgi:hypothetical protein
LAGSSWAPRQARSASEGMSYPSLAVSIPGKHRQAESGGASRPGSDSRNCCRPSGLFWVCEGARGTGSAFVPSKGLTLAMAFGTIRDTRPGLHPRGRTLGNFRSHWPNLPAFRPQTARPLAASASPPAPLTLPLTSYSLVPACLTTPAAAPPTTPTATTLPRWQAPSLLPPHRHSSTHSATAAD